jgi:D-alanyl-D-alanine carboxypeptidase (penicillin-binding protein 5/6)
VPVIDLFYAAALPSGADATTALAELTAGSEAAFAERMNAKAAEMGLIGTHFVNASGLHDDAHYSTVREIAAIFAYAMQIEPLREIMSSYQYTTTATSQNPEGILLTSTLFAYLSGDELPGMKILAGKTGYTLEAQRCLVSLGVREDGHEFIAVTVGGENRWIPITDAVELYAMCLPEVPTADVAPTDKT